MSVIYIRKALEAALATLSPALPTAYENVKFDATPGMTFQSAHLLLANPANPSMGDGYYREQGLFQITLVYPLLAGTGAAAARAELIRSLFKRGACFTSGTVTVKILDTPAIGAGQVDGAQWALPVKVRWSAEIFS